MQADCASFRPASRQAQLNSHLEGAQGDLPVQEHPQHRDPDPRAISATGLEPGWLLLGKAKEVG